MAKQELRTGCIGILCASLAFMTGSSCGQARAKAHQRASVSPPVASPRPASDLRQSLPRQSLPRQLLAARLEAARRLARHEVGDLSIAPAPTEVPRATDVFTPAEQHEYEALVAAICRAREKLGWGADRLTRILVEGKIDSMAVDLVKSWK